MDDQTVKPFHSYLVQEKYFISSRVTDYVVVMQTITNVSDYKEFSFLTGKFASCEVLPAIDFQHIHDFDYHQGERVTDLYEN